MNILICNDDGYQAKGISVLVEVAKQHGNVRVIAPDRNRTASSHSLTLHKPLNVGQADNGFYYINGTPTDCVHVAFSIFDNFRPDWVFSGINHGANMGDDVLYSGTVASATQGYLMGIPSVAFSLNDKTDRYWDTAKIVADKLIAHIVSLKLNGPILWNVNIPRVPPSKLKGVKTVMLGRRCHDESVITAKNPYGETIYWVGVVSEPDCSNNDDSDFVVNNHGYVTITPLTVDLTQYSKLQEVSDLFDHLKV